MNIKQIWEKITSGGIGWKVIVGVVIVVVAAGLGVPLAETQSQVTDQSTQITQQQNDYNTLKAAYDAYVVSNDASVAVAQAKADSAYTLANNVSQTFGNFYTNEYMVYLAASANASALMWAAINKLNLDDVVLQQLCQTAGPIPNAKVISGMTIQSGETVMDGVVQITFTNPLAVTFNGKSFDFILSGDMPFQGIQDLKVIQDSAIQIHPHDYDVQNILFGSDVFTVPAHSTVTLNLTFHIVFKLPVTQAIKFTPMILLH